MSGSTYGRMMKRLNRPPECKICGKEIKVGDWIRSNSGEHGIHIFRHLTCYDLTLLGRNKVLVADMPDPVNRVE